MDEHFNCKLQTLIVELLKSGSKLTEIVQILANAMNAGVDPLMALAACRSERDSERNALATGEAL